MDSESPAETWRVSYDFLTLPPSLPPFRLIIFVVVVLGLSTSILTDFSRFFRELETYVSSSRAGFGDSGKAFPPACLPLDGPVGAASSVLSESSVQQAPAGRSMGGRGMAMVAAASNGGRSGGVGGGVGVGAEVGDDEGHLAQVWIWCVDTILVNFVIWFRFDW